MLSKLTFKFGHTTALNKLDVELGPVTIFVGPNNSGKSRVLNEINAFCSSGNIGVGNLIIDGIEVIPFSQANAEKEVDQIPNLTNHAYPATHIYFRTKQGDMAIDKDRLIRALINPTRDTGVFAGYFLQQKTLILDGRSRISLVGQQQAGDLLNPGHLSLQTLFIDDTKRIEVRRIIKEAFGTYFVIDPTHIGNLRIRLSETAPSNHKQERGLDNESVKFHSKALLIDEASDGVKAFTGIITEVIAGDPLVMMIDEPEAFLHPSLAYKLGGEVSKAALENNKKLFVSTHSPFFTMGCIQSGAPINIIRLTYRGGVGTARLLNSADLVTLMRHPLLRSAGVINALFHEFVVVTESDADRAFYQEINDRLLRFNSEWGIPNCLFINAQNKQTIQTIIRPLRKLGIPAAAIVDIDVVKDGGKTWIGLMESAAVPNISHTPLSSLRASVELALKATGKNMKVDGGINILAKSEKQAANDFFDTLDRYGVFAVRGGELESWLKNLGCKGHSPDWLIEIFTKMGEDPTSPAYIKPTKDDVWKFIHSIKKWLLDANRQGIPE